MSQTLVAIRWRRLVRGALLLAIAATIGQAAVATSPVIAGGAAPPTAVRDLVVSVSGDEATVTWRAPRRGSVASYRVEAHRNDYYNEVAPDFGLRIVDGSRHSIAWPGLPLGQPVYFTVTPIGPAPPGGAPASKGPLNATGRVIPTNAHCEHVKQGYCVVVDTTDRLGVERRPGAGLLHGTVSAANRWVRALHLTHWRIQVGNADQYRQVTAVVRSRNVIEILSDAWTRATLDRSRHVADPWADWKAYTNFVTAAVRRAKQAGEDPIWEIQNEPENYPYSLAAPPTRARIEQQYLKAYRAIRRVAPDARIIGPSINWQDPLKSSTDYVDMKAFVSFAAAHGMRPYALAWHDNTSPRDHDPLLYSEMPEALRDEAQQVRELIAEHPRIGTPKLFVDENSSAAGHFIPGFEAGYLAAEDEAGVDEANRSCWDYPGPKWTTTLTCFGPNLGELLNADGVPNPSYWLMVDYGKLSGERNRSEVSTVDLSSLAVTGKSGVTRLLLGRHQTCSEPTTGPAYCAGPATAAPPVPTVVKVLVRRGARSADISVQRIPNSVSDMKRAPAFIRKKVRVTRGVATVSIPSVADGSAAFMIAKPNSSKGRPARSGDRTRHAPAALGSPRATRILPVSGSHQSAAILKAFPQRPVALATDQYGNPAAGRRVTFSLTPGFAHFNGGGRAVTLVTNRDGVATAPKVIAGARTGQGGVSAYFTNRGNGPTEPSAYFSLYARLV